MPGGGAPLETANGPVCQLHQPRERTLRVALSANVATSTRGRAGVTDSGEPATRAARPIWKWSSSRMSASSGLSILGTLVHAQRLEEVVPVRKTPGKQHQPPQGRQVTGRLGVLQDAAGRCQRVSLSQAQFEEPQRRRVELFAEERLPQGQRDLAQLRLIDLRSTVDRLQPGRAGDQVAPDAPSEPLVGGRDHGAGCRRRW